MREVGKLYKIYKGFFGDELPEKETKERREICAVCPFNSVNAEKLSLVGEIRSNLTGPYCTLCKCQIKEKTSSPLEECAMYMIGEEKKWFKIKIETMENNSLNLIQIGTTKFDIGLDGDDFVLNLGKVTTSSPSEMELLFEAKAGMELSPTELKTSCGCTSSKIEKVNDSTFKASLKVDISSVGYGSQLKHATLKYKLNGKPFTQKIKIKLFRLP